MAFNSETHFEDLTPSPLRSWDTTGWTAPAATEIKGGTMVSHNTGTARLIEVVNDADETNYLGMLAQSIKDLDGGPIEGIRDLVTNDRDFGQVVAIIKGGPGNIIRIGAQDATDTQAGYVVDITNGDDLYLSADGGITNVPTGAHYVGIAHTSADFSDGDILEMTFNPQLRLP
jgi:hypothetical protein